MTQDNITQNNDALDFRHRIETLESQINRQEAILAAHGVREDVDRKEWEARRRAHVRRRRSIGESKHGARALLEDLRFDLEILAYDLKRFIGDRH